MLCLVGNDNQEVLRLIEEIVWDQKMTRKCIELIRVSTESQAADDRASIPAQRAINRRTAASYGLDIVKTIEISDVSGASVLLAPEIQNLLKLIDDPQIHGVITREFSRLMRPESFADYAILQAFSDSNTVLYLPEGPIDFRSKTGRLMGTIRAAIAGLERQEILERMWAAKEEKRKRGEHPQSYITLPFAIGYRERKWFYKPEAQRVREAFHKMLRGQHNYRELAKEVGVTPRGMHLILRNPIYTGWRVINKRRDISPGARITREGGRQGDRKKIDRAPEEIIRVKVLDPLISIEEFNRVQTIMDSKQTLHWRHRPDCGRRFAYNGFLACAVCGNLVYTSFRGRNSDTGVYYVCKSKKVKSTCSSSYMRRDRLEAKLDDLFAQKFNDNNFIRELTDSYIGSTKTTIQSHNTVEDDLAKLDERRKRVLDAFFEGIIDRTDRDTRLARLEEEKNRYQPPLKPSESVPKLNSEDLAEVLLPFYEWKFLNRDDKRALLSSFCPQIHVADYEVRGLTLLCSDKLTRKGKDS